TGITYINFTEINQRQLSNDILDTGGRQPFRNRRLGCLTDLYEDGFSTARIDRSIKLWAFGLLGCNSFQSYSPVINDSKGSCDPSKIPIVFAANKSDKEQSRNIDMQKIERIIDQFSYCVCVETSAKKNINISKLYFKLFFLANVPLEMTPDLHHNIPPENIGLGLLAKEAMVGASLIYFFGSSGMKKDESEAKKCNNFQAFKLKENEATITSPKKEETREALHNFKQIIKPEEIEELTEKCGKKSGPKPKLGRAESFLFNVPLHHNLLFGVRLSDAYGFLVPNVQRPSVQSDIFGLVPRTGAKSTILQIFSFRDCRTGNSTHCCLQ
ncbi:Dexamethasone-induced Ras-related protein 1, partial [Armadillidium vulgare]